MKYNTRLMRLGACPTHVIIAHGRLSSIATSVPGQPGLHSVTPQRRETKQVRCMVKLLTTVKINVGCSWLVQYGLFKRSMNRRSNERNVHGAS